MRACFRLQHVLRDAGRADTVEYHLFSGSPGLGPTHNRQVQATLRRVLTARGIHGHEGCRVVEVHEGGLRYGEGVLYTKNAGDLKVYWQGPSAGWDFGGSGSRTMMLVYNLPATEAIYERFGGIEGSAYFIGGFGMTALTNANVVVVPIRAGVGLRLGANVGYLKFTPKPTWNPL